ncbi:MAG TPA: DUF4350 domain-containing protein [Anaerolineales bacterium]|nr:DUF4350 domain-containing protein [Anaerolineales bacterium]
MKRTLGRDFALTNAFSNRETVLTLALISLLVALTVFGALTRTADPAAIPLDSASTAPDGARALYDWLDELGYAVSDEVTSRFVVPAGTDLVFLLEPTGMSGAEADALVEWVEDGGILVFAGGTFGTAPLLAAFDVARGFPETTGAAVAPALPVLLDPPVEDPIPFEANSYLVPAFDDYLPLAALPEGPVAIRFDRGNGRVVLSASAQPFTNAGLKQPGAGAFVLNLAGEAPAGALIWFDEWHHGRRPAAGDPAGPGDWLRRTPAGRAVLYAAGAVFVWIALSGRAFGRPVRPEGERTRRAPLEYITAIAGLNQLAGNRTELLAHYHRRLKRGLAARYRIDPGVPDDEFIEALRKYDPDMDLETLARLLAELGRPDVSETELVRLSTEAAEWLESRSAQE